eukprot:1152168-Pelagomonas_calceolata.AAC.4
MVMGWLDSKEPLLAELVLAVAVKLPLLPLLACRVGDGVLRVLTEGSPTLPASLLLLQSTPLQLAPAAGALGFVSGEEAVDTAPPAPAAAETPGSCTSCWS